MKWIGVLLGATLLAASCAGSGGDRAETGVVESGLDAAPGDSGAGDSGARDSEARDSEARDSEAGHHARPDSGAGGADAPIDAGTDAGTDATTASIAACGPLSLSSALRLAPAAPGQSYVRCATLGPEDTWRMAISPDARRVAARTAAGTVRLIATDTWLEVAQLASPLGRIDAVAFSPDGTSLALLSAEMGEITIWDSRDGSLARTIAGPAASTIDARASSLAFSSDGRLLATSLGTLTDLISGATADWKTGMPVTSALTVNPENLGFGEAIPQIAFSARDALLFVDTEYQIGNSPPSTRLSLRAPTTGQEVVLFDFYSRGLAGFALSPDRRFLALARTAEAQVSGFAAGLAIYHADTGTPAVADPGFTGIVLGFSRDGQRLFTLAGSTIAVLATADLHPLGQFDWGAGLSFLGVSPGDELVATGGGNTSWLSSSTGQVVRTVRHGLDQLTWSPDGRFAAGAGDPAALFYLWRESDGTELCAPTPRGAPAPTLASLGTTLDATGQATSTDGSISVTNETIIHAHSADWSALHVRSVADGAPLRVFGAAGLPRPIAIGAPSGARLYTSEGPDVAVWCR